MISVLMPVYNEAETVCEIIDEVLTVELDGASVELVIVESNSQDGSRKLVSEYCQHPRVQVILQDAPRGKGNAVREAFRHARGEIFLIQDGDREYSISDYPALISPIIEGKADFVLGTRHARGRPMRWIPEAKALSRFLNVGHWIFTALFNITYGIWLTDPFTMYKVFRREAIENLTFVSDRFDFDWELMAKLIRAGYRPYEVPVSYEARSFSGGKKVRPFRDPPTWVFACFRFRFSRLYETSSEHAVDVSAR